MDATAKYYLSGSWLILLIGTFSAYPIGARLGGNVYRMGKGAIAVSVIWFVALLILCIAGMLSSTYSSFLYFQF
jgi:alginate O-acetyltransferase complex protein AlgI